MISTSAGCVLIYLFFSGRIDHTCVLESKRQMFNKAATHAKVVVPPTNSKSSLCENNAGTFVMTIRGGHLGMTPTLLCLSNKYFYLLCITLYVEYAISDIRPPLGFHCIPCVSLYLLIVRIRCINFRST